MSTGRDEEFDPAGPAHQLYLVVEGDYEQSFHAVFSTVDAATAWILAHRRTESDQAWESYGRDYAADQSADDHEWWQEQRDRVLESIASNDLGDFRICSIDLDPQPEVVRTAHVAD